MSKSILVVEDDTDIREAMAVLLTDEGYDVACACGGREALCYLHDGHTPSLILLDVMMPDMDGYAFCAAQKLDPSLAAIPVVLLSGSGNLAQRARAVGAVAALEKPIRMDLLVKTIERLS